MENSENDKTRTHLSLTKGTAVLHYRVTEKIGAGGMGEVYLAEDSKLKRNVALKFLPYQFLSDQNLKSRFIREAEATARLNHPNIVTIYEVNEFQSRPFFAMEYLRGPTLRKYANENDLSLDEILEIALQLCEGLYSAHSNNVIHRDIKPSNITIDSNGNLKILDFGLAAIKGEDELTKTGTTLGTVRYMSPEQVKGKETDFRTDLFSFGIVLYELISGKTPFDKENDFAIMKSIEQEIPVPITKLKSDVPNELERILDKLLAKNPDNRFQATVAVIEELKKVKSLLSVKDQAADSVMKSFPSIAVLPFANMSNDPENEYFADGLTEELLNVLAKNPELKVTGRTSSFAFKGKQEDLRGIGKNLGVETILEGSVRKAGNRVRITTQLVKSSDGFHLWSETYDRVIDDIFEVQDDIARAVSKALHIKLLGENKDVHKIKPEVYELILRGQRETLKWNEEAALKAIGYFRQAIDMEPKNARAWAGLARVYLIQGAYGFTDSDTAYKKSIEAVSKALEFDNNLADAYEVISLVKAAFEFDFETADRMSHKAFMLSPNNSQIVSTYSLFKFAVGSYEEARKLSELALELDPLNAQTHLNHGKLLLSLERFDEAEKEYRKAMELSPKMTSGYAALGITYYFAGRYEEALEVTLKENGAGYRNCNLAMIFHAMGEKEKSDDALNYLLELSDSHSWAYQIASVYSQKHDFDKAFEWLEIARKTHDAGLPHIKVSLFFKNMHSDPRWKPFLNSIGLE